MPLDPDQPIDLAQPFYLALPLALGHGPLDRRGDLRAAGWAGMEGRPRRMLLLTPDGRVAHHGDPVAAHLVLVDGIIAGPGAEPDGLGDLLLGIGPDDVAVGARVVATDDPIVPDGAAWGDMRGLAMRLADPDRSLLVEALALTNWHRRHPRCPRCGAQTEVAGMGWWRHCPEDGSEHYPRTDPAVIALLVDDAGNALLGRQVRWPAGAFSTLAGFVEAGESAEAAVLREIGEEVGLHAEALEYLGSQPWPFPGSLMLGFHARISGTRPSPTVDGLEIAEARWVGRDELPGLAQAGTVRLPGRLSIAHHLIGRWYGEPIQDPWCRW